MVSSLHLQTTVTGHVYCISFLEHRQPRHTDCDGQQPKKLTILHTTTASMVESIFNTSLEIGCCC